MMLQVWALRNSDGSFRGKFHRYDSSDCKGRRMYEENYAGRGDYVLIDLRELPGHHGACQFECCFQGLDDATAVADQYAASHVDPRTSTATLATTTPRGIAVAPRIVYRELASGETKVKTIAGRHGVDPTRGEVSSGSPLGRALVGRDVGDVVLVRLPRGSIEVEILAVTTSTGTA
jgi:hypothetical protein